MSAAKARIEAVLQAVFDQLPTMKVKSVSLSPANPRDGDDVIARIEVDGARYVLCEILSDGRLQSARVVES
ncbi:MAG: hypothetical protein JO000_20035 [Alphaproteobacteria bacterium]|nr:hypothetical protein [Alphaproteobacteria bacterium]